MNIIETPESHHDHLMQEIEYEIDTYGLASLAEVIASLLDARADDDNHSHSATQYRAARRLFEQVSLVKEDAEPNP
jgi:hypothetical protein